MNFPIKASDLSNFESIDDEQATLIVIEAIETARLDDLQFSPTLDVNQLVNNLENWDRYREFSNLIRSQKAQLKEAFSNGNSDAGNLGSAQAIASRALSEYENNRKNNSRIKYYSIVSSAALICILFIGITNLISVNNENTKTTASKTADTQQVQSDQTKQESGQSVDEFSADSPATPEKITSNNDLKQSTTAIKESVKTESLDNNSSSEGIFGDINAPVLVGFSVSFAVLITSIILLIKAVANRRRTT